MQSEQTIEWRVEMTGKQNINTGILFIIAHAISKKAIPIYKICKYDSEENI
jgi:hypothetical protein